MRSIDIRLDVTDAAALGEPHYTTATVYLPEPDAVRPVVLFAYPGGGYGRRYYDIQWRSFAGYSEAEFHVAQGIVFVACDHLGVGESSLPDPFALTYENVAAANDAAARQVMERLATGTLAEGYPAFAGARAVGIGQSMGGCLLTVQQANHRTFAGVGFLGWSGIHTNFPKRGGGRLDDRYVPARGRDPRTETLTGFTPDEFRYCFHYEDEPQEFVAADMAAYGPGSDVSTRGNADCPWGSASMPMCAATMMSKGSVAAEAAKIEVPVFIGNGERDVVTDPRGEPQAYRSSRDITVVEVPRMCHMHNFAGTRHVLWQRIQDFVDGVTR